MKYIITTDSNCDLPEAFYKDNNIPVLPICYYMDGVIYGKKNTLPLSEFYNRMRNGESAKTAAPNIAETKAFFEDCIKVCKNIIHIAFSSGLSSTCQNAVIASEEILDERKDVKITVIDSLCSCMGEGMLLYKAISKKNNGMSYDELIEYLNNVKTHIIHLFTVDDLHYLHNGGRLSKSAAVLGSIINIKPILFVNNNGELKLTDKVRGRKKSLLYLISKTISDISLHGKDIVMISHCDCEEDAMYIYSHLKENIDIKEIMVNQIGPTIGSHSGPGTLAVYYESAKRE